MLFKSADDIKYNIALEEEPKIENILVFTLDADRIMDIMSLFLSPNLDREGKILIVQTYLEGNP
ncbi:hypothetical protein E3E22_05995 [Thermococcus sp. MV5]|uniref:hypothetical protein n=1 Tax=Thermococcus sp. MV5 TaxID=1638272 RepID=UPI00143BAEC6|nr:hypothetical protein [Thermococcus sp. MV5]NJE26176.1 hypothetical protein [Thermococcus sp. MV5]